MSCSVAIGKRANPLVERFRAVEKTSIKTTGNGTRIWGYSPVLTGGEYSGGSFQAVNESKPLKIEITVNPTKLNYRGGEEIDYSGIVVTLKGIGDETYTDEWYPDGTVPFDELILPVRFAQMGATVYTIGVYNGEAPVVDGHVLPLPISYIEMPLEKLPDAPSWEPGKKWYKDYWGGDGAVLGRYSDGGIIESWHSESEAMPARLCWYADPSRSSGVTIMHASEHGHGTVYDVVYYPDGVEDSSGNSSRGISSCFQFSATVDGRTALYWTNNGAPDGTYSIPQCGDPGDNYQDLAWFLVHGEGFDTYQASAGRIPVYWTRSDGERLFDTFEIVISNEGIGENPDSGVDVGGAS